MLTRRAEWMGAANLKPIVLYHVEFVRQRVDRGVAQPRVIVPAEAALIERHRTG